MFRRGTAWSLAGAVVALAVALVSAAPKDSPFTVAVLRRDGLLIPFAAYKNRGWSITWPGSRTDVPLPISISDVPKTWWGDIPAGAPWTAWLAEGEKRPLKLFKPVQAPIFCGSHLAISTDYRGQAPAEREPTVPKDGIATAGDVVVAPITQISVNSPDAARVVEAIKERFDEEEDLASKHFTQWRHPFPPAMRARIPIQLETYFRTTDTGKNGSFRTSYIEAVRRYPALPADQGCGLLTFARGWITEVPGKNATLNFGARVTYCDRADVSFIQPFGKVETAAGGSGPATFWIFQLSSWREEVYSVAHATAEGVKPVVVVYGGACPR